MTGNEMDFVPVELVQADGRTSQPSPSAQRKVEDLSRSPDPQPDKITAPICQRAVFEREADIVEARRRRIGGNRRPDGGGDRKPEDTFGIALSGGGIRSATISLGVLRALGGAGLIPHVDYISSVSGGGYIASFLCSRYVPAEWRGDVEISTELGCKGGKGDPFAGDDGMMGLDHLRQSGRHLLPGGAGDALRLMAMMVRSWLAIHLVLGVTLLSLLMLLKLPQILWNAFALDFEAGWVGSSPLFWPSAWTYGYPISHWFIGSWLLLASLPAFFVAVALFWSYFLTRGQAAPTEGRWERAFRGPGLIGAFVVALVALVFGLIRPNDGNHQATALAFLVLAFAIVAIISYALAEMMDARASGTQSVGAAGGKAADSPRVQEDRVRHRLTRWSAASLNVALVIAALGLLDSAAQTLYVRHHEITYPFSAGAILAVAVPLIRQLMMRLSREAETTGSLGRLLARFGRLLALAGGITLAVIVGLFWAVLAHHLTWFGGPIGELRSSLWLDSQTSFYLTLLVAGAATGLVAISYSFLNLSTFASFYASNLRRAYLGASNARRWHEEADVAEQSKSGDVTSGAGRCVKSVFPTNWDHVDDDVALSRYYDERLNSPIHLINVTINDTASGSSNVTQRDRRGKPLTLSPVGYLYAGNGLRADLLHIPFELKEGTSAEKLPLSTWIGISGAAASTGMGQYGNLGLSLVAGLANLRLGYWWNPGRLKDDKRSGRLGTVQGRLIDELLGRFPGSDGNRWYLTDGGHFENTGAYELIRRRTGLILVCDNGADPEFAFSDLVTLTRRIRIDFDAELKFEDDPDELDALFGLDTKLRQAFGTIQELGLTTPGAEPRSGPYAALGRVTYAATSPKAAHDRSTSTVIWIKPRVCGTEALDLVAYAKSNPPFPQQSTLDQSYTEPQWESYFRLGMVMGDRLFAANPAGTWRPRDLLPLS